MMADQPDDARTKPVQIRLALGAARWALGGGEYDDDGLCEHVVSDDGSGAERRWKVRVPLEVGPDGTLAAGEPTVEEVT